jgi:hypothetical protein
MLALAVLVAGGASLGAQARPRPRDGKVEVPRTHLPPPGMCRIWLDNVPAAQQPAPTNCASAVRNRPRNGRVIFNDEPSDPKLPIVKSLKGPSGGASTGERKVPDEPAPAKPRGRDKKPIIKPDPPEGAR